jgi:hypothetical protein
MRGRLRRPCQPFQVIGVLAVLPVATNSYQFHRAERVGTRPTANKSNRGKFGGRLTANLTVPLSTGLVMAVR